MDNMIDLDSTLLIQLINFLIAIVVLNFLLIRPVREQMSARSTLIQGYASDIEHFTAEADSRLKNYEAALAQARALAGQAREALKQEGIVREQELVAAAHKDARAFLKNARAEVARDAKAASDALLARVDEFAKKSLAKILG